MAAEVENFVVKHDIDQQRGDNKEREEESRRGETDSDVLLEHLQRQYDVGESTDRMDHNTSAWPDSLERVGRIRYKVVDGEEEGVWPVGEWAARSRSPGADDFIENARPGLSFDCFMFPSQLTKVGNDRVNP